MSPAPLSIEPSSANTEALASSRDRVAGRTVLQRERSTGGAQVDRLTTQSDPTTGDPVSASTVGAGVGSRLSCPRQFHCFELLLRWSHLYALVGVRLRCLAFAPLDSLVDAIVGTGDNNDAGNDKLTALMVAHRAAYDTRSAKASTASSTGTTAHSGAPSTLSNSTPASPAAATAANTAHPTPAQPHSPRPTTTCVTSRRTLNRLS